MPTPRTIALLLLLPLACTASPGTTTTGDASTSTTESAADPTEDHATHDEHATAKEPITGSTGHHHGSTSETGHHGSESETSHHHGSTSETGHHHDSTSETGHHDTAGTTGELSPIAAYCECMLANCHDLYHATWGEDHEASEAMCAAAAAMVPSVDMPATMGNSLECRQHYCDLGEAEPGACDSALGGGACVD